MGGIPVQARGDNTIFFNLAAPLMTAFLTALRPLRQTFLHEIRYLTVWVGQANHAQTPIYWCICNPYLWYRCSCAYICIKQSFINHHSISPPSRMMNHPRVRREMCLVHPGTGATALSSALRPTILNFWLQIWLASGNQRGQWRIDRKMKTFPFWYTNSREVAIWPPKIRFPLRMWIWVKTRYPMQLTSKQLRSWWESSKMYRYFITDIS